MNQPAPGGEFCGTMRGGVVELDGHADWPDGTRVKVRIAGQSHAVKIGRGIQIDRNRVAFRLADRRLVIVRDERPLHVDYELWSEVVA